MDCLSTTTGHGLPQMVRPGNLFLKLLWTIFVLIGIAGSVFMIYYAIDEFLQFHVITTTKIKSEEEMYLPGLTICAPNYDTKTGRNAKDMVAKCMLVKNLEWSETCNLTDLTVFNKWGFKSNCFQINFGKNKEELLTEVEGASTGFHLVLYYPNTMRLNYHTFGISNNSARVVYDDVNKVFFPGYLTSIALSRTNQIALGPPYSDCNDSVDYRKVTCIDDCYNKNISEYCGCKWSSVSCEDECKQNITQILARLDSIKSQCRLECPVECNQVTFSLDRLDLPLNEDDFTRNSELKVIPPNYRINSTILTIYYERLETTEITQSESISLISLIANVGGLLGNLEFIFLSTLIFNHLNLNKYLLFFLS